MMEPTAEQLRLLAELGLIAVGDGRVREAEAIIEAVRAYRPGEAAVYIAQGLLEQRRGRPEAAIRLLETEALAVHPGHPMLRAFLGMALLAAGYQARAVETLEAVAADTSDEKASAFARSLLSPGE
jgi:Flp pilus assembly protein TadD